MVPGRLLFLVGAATWLGRTSGLDNGLGKLPALGWNSDYCANCTKPASSDVRVLGGFEYESFIIHVAETLATMNVSPVQGGGSGGGGGTTLQQLGYHCKSRAAFVATTHARTWSHEAPPAPHIFAIASSDPPPIRARTSHSHMFFDFVSSDPPRAPATAPATRREHGLKLEPQDPDSGGATDA